MKSIKNTFLSIKFIVLIIIFFHINNLFSQVFTIGSDTIHKIGPQYYYLTPSDTILADTSVITLNFIDSISSSERSSFSINYNLSFRVETANGNMQYLVPSGSNYVQLCNQIISDTIVENLITHFYMKPAASYEPFDPDDYYISTQWYLEKIKVKSTETNYGAWDLTFGNSEIKVAVLDFGLQWDLEEFGPVENNVDVVYHNPGEDEWGDWEDSEGGNGTDGNDDNTLIDDLRGYDFFNVSQDNGHNEFSEDNDVRQTHSNAWHGTAVTGIIAAKSNNEEGIAGIAGGDIYINKQGATIIPIKVGDKVYDYIANDWMDVVPTEAVERAINYAIELGANVINMSIGTGLTPKENLKEEVTTAHENNIFIVAAAGNNNYSNKIAYPARMEYIVAVGATNDEDFQYELSNSGPELDLSAPGEGIYVLDNDGDATTLADGNSFSAPMVAATAALMMSVNPTLKSDPDRIEEILKATAEKVGYHAYVDGWNKHYGYGRINALEALCMAIDEKPATTILSNQVWTDKVFSKKDITVESGASLTIKSGLFMGKDTKIIVKPGGNLILNGGYITNIPFCGEENYSWDGIEVWGTGDGHQYLINGAYTQGKLEIKNNSVIENAVAAVRLYDNNDKSKTGGIVFAENSTFLNNGIAIAFFPYKNVFQNEEYNYRSWFKDCSFIEDDNILTEISSGIRMMALLYGVKGISFKGCTFSNNRSNYEFEYAILTYNAGFNIRGYCTNSQTNPCPTADLQRTSFNSFKKAIYSTNSAGVLYSIDIRESDFNSNGYGIFMRSITDAIIVQNNFVLGSKDDCTVSNSTGIYLDNCKRFAVEENDFDIATNPVATIKAGINIVNTKNSSDEIYNNTFRDLDIANIAQGKNWGDVEGEGLAYYCNNNRDNQFDFLVAENLNTDDGIQKFQGSRSYSAGNIFSSIAYSHFENFGEFELDYFYNLNQQNEIPDINKLHRVTAYPISITNSCPSHYGDCSTRLNSSELQQKQLQYTQALNNYISSKSQFDSLGSSIDSATKQMLEEQMSYYNMLLSRSAYDIIRSEQADTVVHSSSIDNWLTNLDNISATQSRVELYIQEVEYSIALELLDSIPELYAFSSYDSSEFTYYSILKSLQTGWLINRRNIFELNTGELSQLTNIASNSKGIAGAQAKGILEIYDNDTYSYIDCLTMPDTTTKNKLYNPKELNRSESIIVNVKPNPASTQIKFDYFNNTNASQGLIQVWNTRGQMIHSSQISQSNGSLMINVESWQKGLYIYSLIFGDQNTTGKFIINR